MLDAAVCNKTGSGEFIFITYVIREYCPRSFAVTLGKFLNAGPLDFGGASKPIHAPARIYSFLAHDKARVIYAVGLVVRAANTCVSRVIRRKGGLMAMVFTVVANENRLWWVARDRVLNCNFSASHSTFLGLPIVGSFRATAFNGDFCAGMRLGRSPLPFPTLGGGCVTPADSCTAAASCFSATSGRSWHDLSREHQNGDDREPKQSLQHGA
mmetsp:Transcript_48330/g.71629  ORF Transcript_48330/g.71629 Transcript_48330/m.71629 type:complete len:212 (-) Transcript_48330:136-771(-)|eukprot:CAMPEP_0195512124 /NCGR_PEP_ID=MMETSP0794_2-20130614/4195_1 /TAXON_ID=515487 /ORGANISM="Stephanopyxis turris, Strain CCMP 815" /LENGTH=211 /DNA_ID=CAMNT_0040639847 /DNA_START=120 /DNA_END=755 /DNA_ORIENTATION=+